MNSWMKSVGCVSVRACCWPFEMAKSSDEWRHSHEISRRMGGEHRRVRQFGPARSQENTILYTVARTAQKVDVGRLSFVVCRIFVGGVLVRMKQTKEKKNCCEKRPLGNRCRWLVAQNRVRVIKARESPLIDFDWVRCGLEKAFNDFCVVSSRVFYIFFHFFFGVCVLQTHSQLDRVFRFYFIYFLACRLSRSNVCVRVYIPWAIHPTDYLCVLLLFYFCSKCVYNSVRRLSMSYVNYKLCVYTEYSAHKYHSRPTEQKKKFTECIIWCLACETEMHVNRYGDNERRPS